GAHRRGAPIAAHRPEGGDRRGDAQPRPRLRGDGQRAPDTRALRRVDGRAPKGGPRGGGSSDRACPRAPGADRPRHRRPLAGRDRRLDPRRVAHGATGRHREPHAPRRAAVREGRRARRVPVARTGLRCRLLPPVGPLPLPVRNRLAELVLEAFEPGEALATVLALASACEGSPVSDADAGRLLALGWFEPAGPGRVRLIGAHRAHGPGLAARSARAASMLRDWRDSDADDMTRLLDRAAALANHGLFFEVHELLE